MNIWFILWILLSIILLGVTGWSTYILFQQKKAWKQYAKKYGLKFDRGTTFGPCTIEGTIKDYTLNFFTALQQNEDSRKNRQLTVMQITAAKPFVDGVAAGTKEMLPFLETLEALEAHEIKVIKWPKKFHVFSRNKAAVNKFLNEERAKILGSILSMPNSDTLVLLDDKEGVFRFETPNPLASAKQIDSVIKKLIAKIEKFAPDEDERRLYSSMEVIEDSQPVLADMPVDSDGGLELELEEDEGTGDEKPVIQDAISQRKPKKEQKQAESEEATES